jgi:chromosome segregation ATPase
MARGKHASSAAATRVREEAVAEATAAKHQITRLTREITDLQDSQSRERADTTECIRELTRTASEVTSPLVQSLQEQLADAEQRVSDLSHEIARRVAALFHERSDFKGTHDFYAALAATLEISSPELFLTTDGTRSQRRMTPKKLRFNESVRTWAKTNGRPE